MENSFYLITEVQSEGLSCHWFTDTEEEFCTANELNKLAVTTRPIYTIGFLHILSNNLCP